MYLRETRRSNRDGSVARYLQLAHNERHPQTGVPTAKVIHNFGRVEQVDRAGLARLVSSISRFLDPASAVAAASGLEVEVLESRRLGGAWTLDRVWERLGIGAAIRSAAGGRRLDAEAVERVIFALVAQRALEPGSKLAATRWVGERVAIEGCAGFDTDAAYAAMDFLLDALGEIAAGVFDATATLLNLSCDVIFVDTTSTYWELEGADELADLVTQADDDEVTVPDEGAVRTWGHSKDHRPELPQVVIAMAVTREGVPIRCWTFPGNTADTAIIRRIKDDLTDWRLHRLVWVADRGFASAANRAYLTRGGGHYIHAEKLRHTNAEAAAALARAGRYHSVAGNLRVKEVRVSPGGGDADGVRAERFVVVPQPGGRRPRRRRARAADRPPRRADRRLGRLERRRWTRRPLGQRQPNRLLPARAMRIPACRRGKSSRGMDNPCMGRLSPRLGGRDLETGERWPKLQRFASSMISTAPRPRGPSPSLSTAASTSLISPTRTRRSSATRWPLRRVSPSIQQQPTLDERVEDDAEASQ